MQVTPISRPTERARDVAAGLVLHPEEQRAELSQMAAAVVSLGPVGRDDLLEGLKHARADWASQAESSDKSRAGGRMDTDLERLESLPGESLADLSAALLSANHARQNRLGLFCKAGIALALGSFAVTMGTGHWLPLAVGVAGVGAAATAAVKRYQTPERDTLSRLATYGAIAQQRSQAANEARQLVEGLGARKTHGIVQTDQGVQVGGVLLKRRSP